MYLLGLLSALILFPFILAQQFNDSYDYSGLADNAPIGIRNGLLYTSWRLNTADPLTGTAGGIIPRSGNNTAVSSNTTEYINNPPAIISVAPGVACFDVLTFYYACNTNAAQGENSTAEPCQIAATATGSNGVTTQELNFPNEGLPHASPMFIAVLYEDPLFQCLQSLVLQISGDYGRDLLMQIDNFVHVNHPS